MHPRFKLYRSVDVDAILARAGTETVRTVKMKSTAVASEAYHDWSGEAADAQLRVNFTLKLLLSQNFCNRPLMRFITFASNIGPRPRYLRPAPSPLNCDPLLLVSLPWVCQYEATCLRLSTCWRTLVVRAAVSLWRAWVMLVCIQCW